MRRGFSRSRRRGRRPRRRAAPARVGAHRPRRSRARTVRRARDRKRARPWHASVCARSERRSRTPLMSTRSADSSFASPLRTRSVRVAIAEDSLLVREGLHRILRDAGFDIVAEAATREQLIEAVERGLAGGVVVDPALVAQLLERRRQADPLEELTPREREVLNLMAEGLTDRGIAQRLYVTPKTVETHARHIFQKLALPESALENKRVQAVLTYLRA